MLTWLAATALAAPAEDARALIEASRGTAQMLVRDGLPVQLNGTVPIDGRDDLDRALRFLSTYQGLYQVDPYRDLFLVDARADEGRSILRFRQRVDGVEIHGAWLTVQVEDGAVVGTSGAWLGAPTTPPTPAVNAARAQALALDELVLPADGSPVAPRRVLFVPAFFGEDSDPVGAWLVDLWDSGSRVIVDDQTGRILQVQGSLAHAIPDFQVIDMDQEVPDYSCWDLTTACDEDGCDSNDPHAWGAFLYVPPIYDYFHDEHDWTGNTGNGGQVEVVVDMAPNGELCPLCPTIGDNAAYDKNCDRIVAATGWTTNPDPLTHEWGHGVTWNTSALEYAGECGMVDEHFADTFVIHKKYTEVGGPEWDVLKNDWSVLKTFGESGFLHYSSVTPTTGFHTGGGVLSNAYRFAWQGGFVDGFPLTGIGSAVQKIWFEAMHDRTGETTTMEGFRDALVGEALEAVELGEIGPDGACHVSNALWAVGLETDNHLDDPFDLFCDGDPEWFLDWDMDTVANGEDSCPQHADPLNIDTDGDGAGDVCDDDDDDDGIADVDDDCPLHTVAVCTDADGDGVFDDVDKCPDLFDDQWDSDGDGEGNACDDDDDDDGVDDDVDNCPTLAQTDFTDTDGDGRGDDCDNCDFHDNFDQLDDDGDDEGDVCDDDDDGDGVLDYLDNCPLIYNPDQADADGDGFGFPCDGDEQETFAGHHFEMFGQGGFGPPERLPLPACTRGCGTWIAPDQRESLTVTATAPMALAVVDERGRRLAHSGLESAERGRDGRFSTTIEWTVPTDQHYVVPATGEIISTGGAWLQLMADASTRERVDVDVVGNHN